MIELQTGKITFPELNITVSPLLHYADFISDFPKDKITQIRDMRNGYILEQNGIRVVSERTRTTRTLSILCLPCDGSDGSDGKN